MKLKKIPAMIMCAIMLITVFAGCKKEDGDAPPEEAPPSVLEPFPDEPDENAGTEAHSHDIDYDAAFAAFAPDTIMMVIGDYNVTWDELFFYLRGNINGILQYGEIHDWNGIVYEDYSYADLVLNYAGETAVTYKAVEYGAAMYGATLGADVINKMNEEFESTAEMLGGEEAFLDMLWEMDGISSRGLYEYLVKIGPLANAIFNVIYGENGELLADEEVALYTVHDGYLMAKHILRMKTDEEEDPALADAEEILERLESYDGDDFASFFDELMWELSEDSGALELFPNGYLFQYGDMVPEFYDACGALEIGAFSSIVETTYGYHIIYRLPIDFDDIPIYYFQQLMYGEISQEECESMKLRNIAALGMFDTELYGWMDDLVIEYTSAYESMDFSKIFDLGEN